MPATTLTPRSTGALDGWTILRFARAFGLGGGGVETYLHDLHRALSATSRITTIQMSLTTDPDRSGTTLETPGGSRLVEALLRAESQGAADGPWEANRFQPPTSRLVGRMLEATLRTATLNRLAMRTLFRRRAVPRRQSDAVGAGAAVTEILQRERVNLVVLHMGGGADASEMLDAAELHGVPVVLVHHFSSSLLGTLSIRQQVVRMKAVGAVSLTGAPRYLRHSLWPLLDGIDTSFFSPQAAHQLRPAVGSPCLYAPARVTPEKGQADVIRVSGILRRRGLPTTVLLAGRIDSPQYENDLRGLAREEGLSDSVTFLGSLSSEQVRDWYQAASLMLLPTRHVEGLPRSILECQAMTVPPIAYEAGGVREGIREGETGFVVTPGDVEGLADRAEMLLRDAPRRSAMGEAGRAFVTANFSLAALGERHTAFYRAAVAKCVSPEVR